MRKRENDQREEMCKDTPVRTEMRIDGADTVAEEKERRSKQRRDTMMAQIHAHAERVRRSFSEHLPYPQSTRGTFSSKGMAESPKDPSQENDTSSHGEKEEKKLLSKFAPHVGLGMPAFQTSEFRAKSNIARRGSDGAFANSIQPTTCCSKDTICKPISQVASFAETYTSTSNPSSSSMPIAETQKRRRGSSGSPGTFDSSEIAALNQTYTDSSKFELADEGAVSEADALFFRSLADAIGNEAQKTSTPPSPPSDSIVLNQHSSQRIVLNNNDVLFGHDLKIDNIGNRRLQVLLGLYQKEFIKTDNIVNRKHISKILVESIRNATPSGRFFCFDTSREIWTQVSQDSAESFVCGMLLSKTLGRSYHFAPPGVRSRVSRRQSFVGRSA